MPSRPCARALLVATLYVFLASTASAQTIWYVDAANCPGPGNGTPGNPFCKIQDAINAAAPNASPPDEIHVADGLYTGTGNKNLDFGGKTIKLGSASGNPAACIIDCQGSGRGFYFHTGETAAALVEGFTIRNGYVTSSTPGGANGGGVFCTGSSPTLTNCIVIGNTNATSGAGVYCSSSSNLTLTGCTISGNVGSSPSSSFGGGLYCSASNPTLNGCTITLNTAYTSGGGVSCYNSSPSLVNCTISDNTASTNIGGGMYSSGSSPALTDCTISGNTGWGAGGGLYYLNSSTPTLTRCTISNNHAYSSNSGVIALAGGIYCENSGLTATDCSISRNTAYSATGGYGGGIISFGVATGVKLFNCIVSGNTATHGAGLYCLDSNPILTNCTITANTAYSTAGGVYCSGSSRGPRLTNCILWGDQPQEIDRSTGNPLVVTYCDVQGGWTGTGNRNTDPGFAFPGDFRLQPGSSCIDVGTNTPLGGLPAHDADGNPRPLDGNGDGQARADLGAYEFNPDSPWIAVDSTRLVLYCPEGQTASEPKTLSLRNVGGGTLSWTLDWDAPWLEADPVQGESTGEVDSVTLTGDVSALPLGTYTTTLTVSAPQASNDPRLIDVVLNVTRTLQVPAEYPTIQAAIDAAVVPGDQVILADGVYTGAGNKDLDYHGKALTVRSASGNSSACVIDCQRSGRGFYFHSGETSDSKVVGVTIRNGYVSGTSPGSGYGAGVHCSGSSCPTLSYCTITGNSASICGGALYCYGFSSPSASYCAFHENAAPSGGGVASRYLSEPILSSCSISKNTATSYGGGAYYEASRPFMINCLLAMNAAVSGGGAYCLNYACPAITNCTMHTNVASSAGGGLAFSFPGMSRVTNSILWDDLPQEIYPSTAAAVVAYCDVQGGYSGTGNIDADPGFALADDGHLMSNSPCIDAGTNTPVGGLSPRDGDENPRPLDGNNDGLAVVDMGMYEFDASAPAIAVSPARVVFYVPEGEVGQEPKTLSIRATGNSILSWTLDWEASWLQADPVQGESAGEIDTITLSADARALTHGTYSTALVLTASPAANSPRVIEVVLNVTAELHVPSEYLTIQAAIDAAIVVGDQVILADGTYTGSGNRDLDFRGQAITVRSAGGNPAACIIDCQQSGRGFYFHSGETEAATVQGLTISNGYITSSSPGGWYGGGGVLCSWNSTPTLIDCIISGNRADQDGGGVYCETATLTNCVISENIASSYGGGIYCAGASRLKACTITGNTAYSGDGGGVNCYGYARLEDCTISDNHASDSHGGGVFCGGSSSVVNCVIEGNVGYYAGGGVGCSGSSIVSNCLIRGNLAGYYGAGVYCDSSATFTNCAITGNGTTNTDQGGGIYCITYTSSNPKFTNCTIAGNTAAVGGSVSSYHTNLQLINCVVWGNTPEAFYIDGGTPVVSYSDVRGGYAGTGNINLDPLFTDPDGPDNNPTTWQDNDYRLAAGSPCVDAGKNAAVPADMPDLDGDGNTTEAMPFDLDGLPRFTDDPATADCPYVPGTCGTAPIVDMGAYEYQPPPTLGDLNCDGLVNVDDVAAFVLALVDPAAYPSAYPGCDIARADMNGSGAADGEDVQPFVDALLGP